MPLRLLLLIACLLAGPATASQQEELENLRRRIAEMQDEIARTSESKTEAADALRASERAISQSNRKLAELSDQQREADVKLTALQIQQQQLGQSIARQKGMLEKLLYQQYLSGRHDYLKLMLDNQDPNKDARDLQYFQYAERKGWCLRNDRIH
jgi:septal ring factor EnvC (AmiA/AmiB activator)